MPDGRFVIDINGREATDLYGPLDRLEVELSDEMPATFTISLALSKRPASGLWRLLDDEKLRLWNAVTIRGGFVGSAFEDLVSGFITRVTPRFAADEDQCLLEIAGIDSSVRMDRHERLKDWPNKKDSDIAREILAHYGFTAEDGDVEDTDVVHDEAMSTVIQRETDHQFLQRLALRNGFSCYVEGTNGFFRSLPSDDSPQPGLAVHFGAHTNVVDFAVTVDGLRPTDTAMYQIDRFDKRVLAAEVETGTRRPLGRVDARALLRDRIGPSRVHVAGNAATGTTEMTTLCQGLFRAGSWFVEGEGQIDAAAYGHVLRPRRLVPIRGIGETYSGNYQVALVRHLFTCDAYTQQFRVKRDALLPTGAEDHSSNGRAGRR